MKFAQPYAYVYSTTLKGKRVCDMVRMPFSAGETGYALALDRFYEIRDSIHRDAVFINLNKRLADVLPDPTPPHAASKKGSRFRK